MRVSILKLVGEETLGGSVPGEILLGKLKKETATAKPDTPILLDFDGIAVATYSYLRASVMEFREHIRKNNPECPVIIASLSEAVAEELSELLKNTRDALIVCDLENSTVRNAHVLGILDDKQQIALRAVLEFGSTDAPTLARRFEGESDRRFTKWNNRLSALAQKGILAEKVHGRSKRYSAAVEGLTYGD